MSQDKTNLEFCREDEELEPRAAEQVRIILPNAAGDAFGNNKDTDSHSIAVTTIHGKLAHSIRYGVAYAPNGGTANAGAIGAAVSQAGGTSTAGDGGCAFATTGTAITHANGVAYARKGSATVNVNGVAMCLLEGSAKAGIAGIACAQNFSIRNDMMITNVMAGKVAAGHFGVVIAYREFEGISLHTKRRPVVGIIGSKPEGLTPKIEALLLAHGVQFGLVADTFYRLDANGQFVEATQ